MLRTKVYLQAGYSSPSAQANAAPRYIRGKTSVRINLSFQLPCRGFHSAWLELATFWPYSGVYHAVSDLPPISARLTCLERQAVSSLLAW